VLVLQLAIARRRRPLRIMRLATEPGGCPVTPLIDLVDEDTRRRLLQRLRQLNELDRLIREPAGCRPPEPPPPLAALRREVE
jgi:hypothetical protein